MARLQKRDTYKIEFIGFQCLVYFYLIVPVARKGRAGREALDLDQDGLKTCLCGAA